MAIQIDPSVLQETIDAYYRSGQNKQFAANELGLPRNTFCSRLATAEREGYKPSPKYLVPTGHVLKGKSMLVDAEGNTALTWVKTSRSEEMAKAALLAAIEACKEAIPRQTPIKAPAVTDSDLLSCYVITDYHIGQMSWGEETGQDWDIKIAEDTLVKWIAAAIKHSPNSQEAIFANIGDLIHTDGILPVTPTSGHVLDADTRFAKMVRVAIRVIRRVINMLLEKHERVYVLMSEGNHDITSSIWLRELLVALYENEPRVTINPTVNPYYAYKHGETALFFHHGHKRKLKEVSRVFAGQYPEIFGATKYRYAHMGHMHHTDIKEDQLMVVEQHQTLAARDAHASSGGYMSQRGSPVITYHKRFGEFTRTTIRPEMLA
jgi:hypothetical protein